MNHRYILAIDPGTSGGWAYGFTGCPSRLILGAFDDETFEVLTQRVGFCRPYEVEAVMENVHASPVMSPSSAFAFGRNLGQWETFLRLNRAVVSKVTLVTPQTWQSAYPELRDLDKTGRKSALNSIANSWAREINIDQTPTLKTCDALLLWRHQFLMNQNSK